MLHGISYGGSLGDTLFTNAIAASPYLPMQYGYKDWVPSQAYYAFAIAAGCAPTLPHGRQVTPTTIFQCLVAQNSSTLSFASAWVSGSGKVGTLVFLPVTDGDLLPEAPSQALLKKRVNGRNLLVGNNADEGSLFVQSNITTEADLVNWLRLTFPMFSSDDIAKVLLYYPTANAPADDESPHIARGDYEGTAAAYQNAEAPGQQERANVRGAAPSSEHFPLRTIDASNADAWSRTSTRKQLLCVLHTGWPRPTRVQVGHLSSISTRWAPPLTGRTCLRSLASLGRARVQILSWHFKVSTPRPHQSLMIRPV